MSRTVAFMSRTSSSETQDSKTTLSGPATTRWPGPHPGNMVLAIPDHSKNFVFYDSFSDFSH